MYLVTRNSPLIHWNNKCPDLPEHHWSYRRLCFNGKKIKNTVRVSDSLDLSGQTWARTVCKQKKNDREDAPTHPLTEISGKAYERQTRIQVHWQLLYFCLSTPPPPTVKVIWRQSHSFQSHPIDWWRKGKFWLFFKLFYICVCVCGGGGPVTSFTFRNSRGGGGPKYVIQGRGGGRQTFYQGSGVQLLSDRTCDLYWTPIPPLDPRNYHEF